MILAKPHRVPAASYRVVMTTLAQKVEPSLRTRHPSSSNRPSARATFNSCSGQPRSTALGLVEEGKVPAQDLFGPVALDQLRPTVPTDHVPLGVEHEDGVILHPLHQHLEPLLARLIFMHSCPPQGVRVKVLSCFRKHLGVRIERQALRSGGEAPAESSARIDPPSPGGARCGRRRTRSRPARTS